MQYIFNHLKTTLKIFSDGATSSQFKQKYLFLNLYEEHDLIKIKWNFFATYGKGVVDGIGGTVKHAVWRHIRSEQANVTNAKEYADIAKLRCPNIQVAYIDKKQNGLVF